MTGKEERIPRFAELDRLHAQEPADAGSARGPRGRAIVPAGMRSDILRAAQKLARRHEVSFGANPKLRECVARLLLRGLPPKPRRPGRPQQPSVTTAIRLLKQFRRQFRDDSKQQRWQRIAQAAVPGYAELVPFKQSKERGKLRGRVNSCLRQRRRRRAKKTQRNCSPPNNL